MFYGYSKDICVEDEPPTLTILSSGEEEQESDNKREPATEKSLQETLANARQLRGKVRATYNDHEAAFEDMDNDNDGFISRTEFKNALLALGMELPEKPRRALRSHIDRGQSKKISPQDFSYFMQKYQPEREQANHGSYRAETLANAVRSGTITYLS